MMRRKNSARGEGGFTIVELLVAVGLSVLLVGVVTMAFQVTTSTIETVQRKLDIYEAARGKLQELAMAFWPATLNMSGDYFIIKSAVYQDQDGRTPEDTAKSGKEFAPRTSLPIGGDIDATRYIFSRKRHKLAHHSRVAYAKVSLSLAIVILQLA